MVPFIDKLFRREEDRKAVAGLFAVTNWQGEDVDPGRQRSWDSGYY